MADQRFQVPNTPEIKNNLAQVTPYSCHALPVLASVADGYWGSGWNPHPRRIDSFHPPPSSSRPIWYWTCLLHSLALLPIRSWLKPQDCPPGLPRSTDIPPKLDGSHTCWYKYALVRSKVEYGCFMVFWVMQTKRELPSGMENHHVEWGNSIARLNYQK